MTTRARTRIMSKIIQIPLRDSDKTYDIRLDKLPRHETLIEVLKSANSNLHVWLRVALEYYKKSNFGAFTSLMESTKSFASLDYEGSKLDQIKSLDMMAAFYVYMANREKLYNNRSELIVKAIQLYTTGDKVFVQDKHHLLGRAYISLLNSCEENTAEADTRFHTVLSHSLYMSRAPAKPSTLSTTSNKRDNPKALAYLLDQSESNPNDPNIQLSLAHNNLKLGRMKNAESYFDHVLLSDPKCVDALVGLAAVKLNTVKPHCIHLGMNLVSKAFIIDDSDSATLNHLSNHFCSKEDYKTAELFAKEAFKKADNDTMKAESSYHIAKTFHTQNNYDQALQYYIQSTSFAQTEYILPLFGLSQMYIYKNDHEKAIECLKKIIRVEPENRKALKLISTLYAASKDQQRLDIGKTYLEKLTKRYPYDEETWTYLGQILENTDPESSLSAYTKAFDILRKKNEKFIPPELYNNIASLSYKLRKFDDSRLKFEESLRLCMKIVDIDPHYYKFIIITTKYNLGRNFEQLQQFQKAQTIYKEILKMHPNYTDCYLRLGCIARCFNRIQEAFDWFTEAIRFDHGNTSAWTLLGDLPVAKAQWECAEKMFNRILWNPSTLNDPYALITLGNYWLQNLHSTLENKNTGIKYQNLALEYFTKVLKNDATNIWAANGIGCVLAYEKCFLKVNDVFSLLADSSVDFYSIWLNIAHVYFEEKQYSCALKMYKQCVKRFSKHDNVEILQYIGSAYFRAGQLEKSKNVFLKAFKIAPYNTTIMFNVASVLQKLSVRIIKYKKSHSKDILEAEAKLVVSQKYFQYLSVNDEHKKHNVSLAIFEAKESQKFLDYVEQARVLDNEKREMHLKQEREIESLKIKENKKKTKRKLKTSKKHRTNKNQQ